MKLCRLVFLSLLVACMLGTGPGWAQQPEQRKAISADMQRLIADQLYWVNATGYPFYQAYRNNVTGYPFYNRAYLFLETTWLYK